MERILSCQQLCFSIEFTRKILLCLISILGLLLIAADNCFAQANALVLQEKLAHIPTTTTNETSLSSLKRFYVKRGYQPIWWQSSIPSPGNTLDNVLSFIASAEQHGLDNQDYELDKLFQLQKRDGADSVSLELELTAVQSLLMLAKDLRSGRLLASKADPDWHIQQQQFDPVDYLNEAIHTNQLAQSLAELPPQTLHYQLLKHALARYRNFEAQQGIWFQIPESTAIRPRASHKSIPLVRKRIMQLNNTLNDPKYGIVKIENERYDSGLVEAVKQFQEQHGLNPDGIIGRQTIIALNKTPKQRIQQLRANMERLRWMPRDLGERHVIVNIAGFYLSAIEGGKHVLEMRIIVGRDYRSTPSFDSRLSQIVLNPYWNVPYSIAVKDLLPKQQNNSAYFASQGIKVFSKHDNSPINPDSINWNSIKGGFPYVLRQNPGKKNALGYIKFLFSNPFSIYLHDTPSRQLFQKDVRTFSSGCIRLEKPWELAKYALNGNNSGINLTEKINSGETITINLPKRVPIYLTYLTAWVGDQDHIHFAEDVYGRDKRLIEYARW
ncbi:MAG: L,D-transpeptidase family protein [Nitrosomonas sp.]|nr:L,D-transpeptidase family protein [Nitrosomonas sp.]